MQAVLISIVSVLGAGLFGFITTVVHGLRADNAQLRDEHGKLRAELKANNADLRADLTKLVEAVHDLANKLVVGMADLEVRLSDKMATEIRRVREDTVGH